MFYYSGLSTLRLVFSHYFFFLWRHRPYSFSSGPIFHMVFRSLHFCIISWLAFFYRVSHQTTIILLDVLAKWLWYEISYNLKNMALKKYQPTSAMGLECPNSLCSNLWWESNVQHYQMVCHRYCTDTVCSVYF